MKLYLLFLKSIICVKCQEEHRSIVYDCMVYLDMVTMLMTTWFDDILLKSLIWKWRVMW